MIGKVVLFLKKIDKHIFNDLINFGLFNRMSDEDFIKLKYKRAFKKELDLENPVTFNEKLQWIKLYKREAIYSLMADKYEVKRYVGKKIGEKYIIPTLKVWDDPDEMDLQILPEQFVLKCTHDSGGVIICRNKNDFNIKAARKKIRKWMKRNYYLFAREWPYKNISPRIIAEKYMVDQKNAELEDYKVHCFNGIPKVILVCENRYSKNGLTEDFYSADWKRYDVKRPEVPNAKKEKERPEQLEEMLLLAGKLSQGIPFVRIDFYIINNQIYFGEVTFFPAAGLKGFIPEEFDMIMGSWITLEK